MYAFLISTKLPTWVFSAKSAPGRKRENGPIAALAPTEASSSTEYGLISTSSPMSQLVNTQPAPIFTRFPNRTLPFKITFMSISTSLPWVNLPRSLKLFGSNNITPASNNSRACFCWKYCSSAVSCRRLFAPSTSIKSTACTAATWQPSRFAKAITSVM